jgi:hypothetical protein
LEDVHTAQAITVPSINLQNMQENLQNLQDLDDDYNISRFKGKNNLLNFCCMINYLDRIIFMGLVKRLLLALKLQFIMVMVMVMVMAIGINFMLICLL